jgi:hypothetical protein
MNGDLINFLKTEVLIIFKVPSLLSHTVYPKITFINIYHFFDS